jgi:hypothetical protein
MECLKHNVCTLSSKVLVTDRSIRSCSTSVCCIFWPVRPCRLEGGYLLWGETTDLLPLRNKLLLRLLGIRHSYESIQMAGGGEEEADLHVVVLNLLL